VSDDFTHDDADDAPPRRRSDRDRPPERMSVWRFISPGTFGAAVILFFLPWTDLSCNGPTGKMQMITQSGYQSAVGEASEGEGFTKLREEMGPQPGMPGMKAEVKLDANDFLKKIHQKGAEKDTADTTEKAPLLWLYLVLLVGGAVVPVFLPAAQIRGAIILGFVGFAVLLLILQMVLGFPLANDAAKANTEMKEAGDMGRNGFGPDLKLGGKVEIKSSYLMAFWGSVLALVASAGLGVVQVVQGRPQGGRGKRSRPRDDDPE
jgi:hypothetical protein